MTLEEFAAQHPDFDESTVKEEYTSMAKAKKEAIVSPRRNAAVAIDWVAQLRDYGEQLSYRGYPDASSACYEAANKIFLTLLWDRKNIEIIDAAFAAAYEEANA